jgi:hypothetical protein
MYLLRVFIYRNIYCKYIINNLFNKGVYVIKKNLEEIINYLKIFMKIHIINLSHHIHQSTMVNVNIIFKYLYTE